MIIVIKKNWPIVVGCAMLFLAGCRVHSDELASEVVSKPYSSVYMHEGIVDLNKIYEYETEYRIAYGSYPKNLTDISRVMAKKAVGLEGVLKLLDELANPDSAKADSIFLRNNADKVNPYFIMAERLDKSPLGSSKLKGTKDILSWTGIYAHNQPYNTEQVHQYSDPRGYYLVLWDDGLVTPIPFDQILYMSDGNISHTAFYGEAGVSKSILLTYAEFWTKDGQPLSIGKLIPEGRESPFPDNGGPEGLVSFSRLLNYPNRYGIERETMWKIFNPAQQEFSLTQIQSAAAKLGLSLQKKTITLDELEKLHTPAMLYLSDAGRIVTISTIDDDHTIILDRGMTLIVSRAELAKRYGGEALIAASVNAPSSLHVDQPIRMLNFSSKDAEVTQNVKITNHGAKPVTLLIERPLCGITDAKLSQDNLAPGASANLELHFKWRSILPGDHQSTFVTLKTDDPAQPRLQLGFDLKLAEAK